MDYKQSLRSPYEFFKGKHVLITGGAGFIGSHFCENLLLSGSHIIVLDNFSTGHNVFSISKDIEKSSGSIEYINGDILDDDSYTRIDEILKSHNAKLSLTIHLAAAISVAESMTDPDKYDRVNRIGSDKVYNYCIRKSVPAIISATSAAVYGDCGTSKITEEFQYGGVSPYAKSKWDMEELTRKYAANSEKYLSLCEKENNNNNEDNENKYDHERKSIHFINCRFFNVYGPRQDPNSPYTGVMSVFFARAKEHEQLTIFGDGEQSRDFIFVSDIVNGALTIAMKTIQTDMYLLQPIRITSRVFNLGTGNICTINKLARVVIELSSSPEKRISYQNKREGDIYFSCSNPSAAKDFCGWKAIVNLDTGMKIVWNWFNKSENDNNNKKSNTTESKNYLKAEISNSFRELEKRIASTSI